MLYRSLTPPTLCLFALLLSACASAPEAREPTAPPASPTVIKPISSNADVREDTAETGPEPSIASPPSIKPELEAPEQSLAGAETPQNVNLDAFPETLSLCAGMKVSNAPEADRDLAILNYTPVVEIEGTQLAIAPVESGCFASGFGLREGRRHKGIDLHNADPVNVLAAADGRVRERVYRDDYGNMLVIEHGDGVFARYAHLERFAPGVEIGATVTSGQSIGVMGNTASVPMPRHLHYEILLGTYGTLTGSFGLIPVDIFDYLP